MLLTIRMVRFKISIICWFIRRKSDNGSYLILLVRNRQTPDTNIPK